jgi:hypothetical protein
MPFLKRHDTDGKEQKEIQHEEEAGKNPIECRHTCPLSFIWG